MKERVYFRVAGPYRELLRRQGLEESEAVFDHPEIAVWRSIPQRENATLDTWMPDGRCVRLHVKRFRAPRGRALPATREAAGIRALEAAGIPSVPLVAWGALPDGRSFTVTEDLEGFTPADRLLPAGVPFTALLRPTALVAARLHAGGLQHRDLYLCHFFLRLSPGGAAVRLIDAARVRRLPPGWGGWQRVVKDLAQFWYSTLDWPVTDAERQEWLALYGAARGLRDVDALRRAIERKVRRIAAHHARLQQRQPDRNVSLPDALADAARERAAAA